MVSLMINVFIWVDMNMDTYVLCVLFSLAALAVLAVTLTAGRKKRAVLAPEISFIYLLWYLWQILAPEYSVFGGLFARFYRWWLYGSEIVWTYALLIFPASYGFVLSARSLTAIIFQRKFLQKSLLIHFKRFLGRKKSLRRKLCLEILFSGILAAGFSTVMWYAAGYILNVYPGVWLVIVPVALETVLLIFIFSGRKSAGADMDCISQVLQDSAAGNFILENPLDKLSPLHDMGEAVIKLGRLTEDGIQKGVAGEKLKVELITNVSHDLRTPLTSIIGYCEQLEGTELSDEAAEYVKRLLHKVKYLNEMVNDLFDLAKAASGNAVINQAEINLHKLIEQTVAEMNDKIEGSGFAVRTRLEAEDAVILADGARMHRVWQNLIDNALKYSLPGTRIYIETVNEGERLTASIINTASYEMDFKQTDLIGRFSRGDSSRTGEGSGLGLAIANTYTEACGGSFEIAVKGDQFEARISFPQTERHLKEMDK